MSEQRTDPAADRGDDPGKEPLIAVRDLKKYYGGGGVLSDDPVKAVDGVSFDIRRGETLGLVGESGCGKTTLGRTLIRLEAVTGGEIRFDGRDVTTLSGADLNQWRRDTQMVFQDPESSLNDRMTVGAIVREPLDVHGWKTSRERRERVFELLETVGLGTEHYYRYPHQFSGGQRQRVGIARALALEPEFVVLDEPVSALDVSVQARIINLLEDLQAEYGLTFLFIAHDLSVVRHIADRVAVMYLGKIMEIGPTERLFDDPANPYTISLLSAIPEPDPTVQKESITLRGTPPSPRDPPQGCPFSTRCPMKIRPAEHADLDDAVWERVELFREVVRERDRAERSLSDRVRELLGRPTDVTDIDRVRAELFDDVETPPAVDRQLDEAVDLVRAGEFDAARTSLRETFGSECDLESPAYYPVDDAERLSYCHRHADGVDDPRSVLEREVFVDR